MTAYIRMLRDYVSSVLPGGRLTAGRDLGQGMIEYALIIGVIVLALIVAYQATGLGSAVEGIFTDVRDNLTGS